MNTRILQSKSRNIRAKSLFDKARELKNVRNKVTETEQNQAVGATY